MSGDSKKSRKKTGGEGVDSSAPQHRDDDAGSIQPQEQELAKFIAREFREQQPQSIDVYPVNKRNEKLERLKHYSILPGERIDASRSAIIANEIHSECQIFCDTLEKPHAFTVVICDVKRGGLANPVATRGLRLDRRTFRPALVGGVGGDDDGDDLSAVKLMQESVKLIHEKDRWQQENEGRIVGDVLIVMRDGLTSREKMLLEMMQENRKANERLGDMALQISQRGVEERAIAIEAANAEENRIDQRSKRERENVWSDVTRASLMGGIDVLKQLFPGFGQLFLAHLSGKPPPPPPQLGAGTQTPPVVTAPAAPTPTPAIPSTPGGAVAPTPATASGMPEPEEKVLIGRFIQAARIHRIDENHTAEERLFGKDTDDGKPIEPGIFKREQVAILSGVNTGRIGVDALDGLLPDSGKPEAIGEFQMMQAMAFLTPPMFEDVMKFMKLRQDARTARK